MTKSDTLKLKTGDRVYCTVRQCAGWYTVVSIRPRDGYMKLVGLNFFSPPHNFTLTPEQERA